MLFIGECFPRTSLEQPETLSDFVGGMYYSFLYISFKEHYFYYSIHSLKNINFFSVWKICKTIHKLMTYSEFSLRPRWKSKVDLFAKSVNGWEFLSVFTKSLILDLWLVSICVSLSGQSKWYLKLPSAGVTYFTTIFHFYTPWKHHKIFFWCFKGL